MNSSNGQVKIGEGDFTFYVKSGYMIENGRFSAPIKDINIIGNGPQALADIMCVGNDLKIDNGTWTCGKEQSVPVSCGIPTVLVKSLTVGRRMTMTENNGIQNAGERMSGPITAAEIETARFCITYGMSAGACR